MADPVKKMMTLMQRRQHQGQAGRARVMLEDRAVDGTKETLRIDVRRVLLPAVPWCMGVLAPPTPP